MALIQMSKASDRRADSIRSSQLQHDEPWVCPDVCGQGFIKLAKMNVQAHRRWLCIQNYASVYMCIRICISITYTSKKYYRIQKLYSIICISNCRYQIMLLLLLFFFTWVSKAPSSFTVYQMIANTQAQQLMSKYFKDIVNFLKKYDYSKIKLK